MIELVPMTDAHVRDYVPQPEEAHLTLDERMQIAMAQAGYGPSWAAVRSDGQVVAIGGICDSWAGRGICWAGLSAMAGASMLALTRAVRRTHDALGYRRLEMFVDARSDAAQRWARLLGFHNETPTPMRAFLPDGSAAYLYARTFR